MKRCLAVQNMTVWVVKPLSLATKVVQLPSMDNLDTFIGLFGGGQTTSMLKGQRGGSTPQPFEWPKE